MTVVLVVFVSLWIFDKLKAVFQAKKGMERRLQDRMGGRDESFDNLGLASSRASSVALGGYEQEWNYSNTLPRNAMHMA